MKSLLDVPRHGQLIPPELEDLLDDDAFWAAATYEPTAEDWAALRELEADLLDPESSPAMCGHPDCYPDESPELWFSF